MKILNVVGARPNLVKIAPLLRAMSVYEQIEPVLLHTGQHYSKELSDIFFQQMKIAEPKFNLNVGSGSQAWQTAEVLQRIEPILISENPDLLLVVGDVNSTLAASLAAAKLGVPVAHVEAGLRSFDRTMPEEINRLVTDVLANYMFVSEKDGRQNLLKEGRPAERIYFVGNVMIDALRHFLPLAQQSRITEDLHLAKAGGWLPFGVVTLHRPSNVDVDETLASLMRALQDVSTQLPLIFPVHPRTRQKLLQFVSNDSQLRLIEPLGYLDFLALLSRARIVLTDSGGIQEETTALGIPCLTLRENTERPITVTTGTNHIVGHDFEKVALLTREVLSGDGKPGQQPELWDGHASERIVEILLREFSDFH
jgi:UDP-N-acetylglucosamine 2-epimerase (non-hydrolysing)